MKNTKRIISLLGVAVIAGTLASCDANRNTKAPTGNLNLNATYASLESQSNISVSVNEMYNQFRMNGYSTELKKIKNALFILLCPRLFVTLSANIKVRMMCFAVFIEKIDKLHKEKADKSHNFKEK